MKSRNICIRCLHVFAAPSRRGPVFADQLTGMERNEVSGTLFALTGSSFGRGQRDARRGLRRETLRGLPATGPEQRRGMSIGVGQTEEVTKCFGAVLEPFSPRNTFMGLVLEANRVRRGYYTERGGARNRGGTLPTGRKFWLPLSHGELGFKSPN